MKRTLQLALPVAVIGTLAGCGGHLMGDTISEGVVEYAMSFPDYDPDGLMAGMLPERTVLSFNEEQQSVDLTAGMGVFRTSMVVNTPKRTMDYHMSVMGKRMVAALGPKDLDHYNRASEAMTVIFCQETDTIAGLPCKKAIAVYKGMDRPEVELWYTDRIAITDPNWYTPFRSIPGVLMRYEVVQYGIRMRLNAVAVKPGDVPTTQFQVRADHDQVAPEVLDHELAQVLGTFSN